MSLVVLRRVSSWEEAVVMISALRSGGISADLFDTLGQARWELQTPLGVFRVMVRADDVEVARWFLEASTKSLTMAKSLSVLQYCGARISFSL